MSCGFVSAILAGHGSNGLKAAVSAVLAGHGCNSLVTSSVFDAIDAQFAFVPWPLASCLQPSPYFVTEPEVQPYQERETISERFGGSLPYYSDDDGVRTPGSLGVNDAAKNLLPPPVRRKRRRRLAWSEGDLATSCRRYFRTGACRFGESCRFVHNHSSALLGVVNSAEGSRDSSVSDLPAAFDDTMEAGERDLEALTGVPSFLSRVGELRSINPLGEESRAASVCESVSVEEFASPVYQSTDEVSWSRNLTDPLIGASELTAHSEAIGRVLAELLPVTSPRREQNAFVREVSGNNAHSEVDHQTERGVPQLLENGGLSAQMEPAKVRFSWMQSVDFEPKFFDVHLTKDNDNSKLGINGTSDGDYLLVTSVGEGLVEQWNEGHPESSVRPGDRIVAVNGVEGKPLLSSFSTGCSWHLRLKRYLLTHPFNGDALTVHPCRYFTLACRYGDACRFSHLTSTSVGSALAERQRLSAAGVSLAAPCGEMPSSGNATDESNNQEARNPFIEISTSPQGRASEGTPV